MSFLYVCLFSNGHLKVGDKCKTIGRFDTEHEARAAYVAARDLIWPELTPKEAAHG